MIVIWAYFSSLEKQDAQQFSIFGNQFLNPG